MSPPNKHHYVPQTYLRYFMNESEQLFFCHTWDTIRTSIKPSGPAGIAFKPQFYRIDEFVGTDMNPWALENLFDQRYERLLPKLWGIFEGRHNWMYTFEKFAMSEMMIHFAMRTPFIREKMSLNGSREEYITVIAEAMIEARQNLVKSNLGFTNEQIEEIMLKLSETADEHRHHYASGSAKELHTNFLIMQETVRLSAKTDLAWKLVQGDWEVGIAPPGFNFIVSDNPGIAIRGTKASNFAMQENSDYYFPISRSLSLKITPHFGAVTFESLAHISYRTLSEQEAKKVNTYTCLSSHEKIFGSTKSLLEESRTDTRALRDLQRLD